MTDITVPTGWNARLAEQLTFHWDFQLRPGLASLTDDEYFWEPVPDCWSVRPRSESTAPLVGGAGALVAEFADPPPDPAPVTTIAWRLAHITIGCLGQRAASHFGAPPIDYLSHEYAATAAGALTHLDATYEAWLAGIRSLNEAGLDRKVGPAEGPYAELSFADLILHINREVIHHSAEILLLRDLYRTSGRGGPISR